MLAAINNANEEEYIKVVIFTEVVAMKEVYKNILTISIFLVFIVLSAVFFNFQLRFSSTLDSFYFISAYLLMFLVPSIIVVTLSKLVKPSPTKEADKEELKREDDILLQATAFSQSALWIYLNILPTNTLIDVMKWLVPAFAIAFYSMRAYAKLKESGVWRYRSIYIMFLVIATSIFSFISTTMSSELKNLLMINNVGVTQPLLLPLFAFAYLGALYSVEYFFKKRYGISNQ